MTKLLTFIMLLFVTIVTAQQKDPVPSGVITLQNGKMAGFTQLRFIGEKVLYYNIATRKNEVYLLSEVKLIANDDQKTIYDASPKKEAPGLQVSDTLFKPDYPEGIYVTKEEFLSKKPSRNEQLIPKALRGDNYFVNTIEDECFLTRTNGTKLTKVFAVSYKGYLYFSVDAILDNRNKTDRAQKSKATGSFVRAIIGGNNYYYAEADLTNIWAEGVAYGGIGGLTGNLLADAWIYKKGIVWDIKNKEFNIFKNCTDYNAFIKPLLPGAVQSCRKQQPDMAEVRKAMLKVK